MNIYELQLRAFTGKNRFGRAKTKPAFTKTTNSSNGKSRNEKKKQVTENKKAENDKHNQLWNERGG